jgi:pimeloyl-ACP methyl ester carboxylesterase
MSVEGYGPVTVFEAGLGQTRKTWSAIVPALAQCLTVVTYDRLGLGQSAPPNDPAAPILATDVATRLDAALKKRGLNGPYLLVGHSLGGLYVEAFARTYPEEVSGMVLIDGTSPLEPPGVFVSKLPPKPGSVEVGESAGMEPSMKEMLKGPPLPNVPLVVLTATNHEMSPDLEALWRKVQERTASLSSKGRFELIDSGHYIQIDRPQAVIDAVLSVAREAAADRMAACRIDK